MADFYNENDPRAVEWLEKLQHAALIDPGRIDSRSVADVQPEDVAGFRNVHLFAGIGGWARALELVRWPRELPVWTCSCPCQPFSGAGKKRGTDDHRHLWPEARRLADECRPPIIVGEQVASPDGRKWFAGVRADLEALGYAVGAADLCAASVGAPHIRQRIYWLAYAVRGGLEARDEGSATPRHGRDSGEPWSGREDRYRLGDPYSDAGGRDRGSNARAEAQAGRPLRSERDGPRDAGSWLGNAERARPQGHAGHVADGNEPGRVDPLEDGPATETGGRGFWSGAEWIDGADGTTRRVKPGIQLLAHGLPNRVGRLRGFGNAIVPQVAELFLSAALDTLGTL